MPQQSILSALINLSVQGKACVIVPIAIQQYPCIYLCILWTCKWIPYTLMNESIDNWHKCVASLGVHHLWRSKNWKCYAVWLCRGLFNLPIITATNFGQRRANFTCISFAVFWSVISVRKNLKITEIRYFDSFDNQNQIPYDSTGVNSYYPIQFQRKAEPYRISWMFWTDSYGIKRRKVSETFFC